MPTYLFCAMLGLLVSTLVLLNALYSKRFVREYATLVYMALPGVILGGKFFSIMSVTLTELYLGSVVDLVKNVKQSGNVYYGGLFGFLVSLFLLCKICNRDFNKLTDSIAISIPLFHSFGRIGCFFAGCCYGIESDLWFAIPYRIGFEGEFVKRIPVQLIEAGFELCLCGLLSMIFWQVVIIETKNWNLLEMYLISYAIFRFVIEFLRGDTIRGVYGSLSFSQIISLLLVIGGACRHVYHVRKRIN